MTSTHFDPNTSFFDLPIVHKTAVFFIVSAVAMVLVIVHTSGLWGKFDLTYKGFNNLLTIFKFPLSFLALSIPVGAIYAANHRSEQTKHQIAITQNQNNFTTYYKHLEEYEKYTNKVIPNLGSKYKLKPITQELNTRHIHKILFPNLIKDGDLSVSTKIIDELCKSYMSVTKSLTFYPVSTEAMAKAASEAFLEVNNILKECKIDSTQFDRGSHVQNRLNIESYKQSRLVENGNLDDIDEVCNSYYVLDVLNRMALILDVIVTCARFESSYQGNFILDRIIQSMEVCPVKEDGIPVSILNPHLELLTVKALQDDIDPNDLAAKHPIKRASLVGYVERRLRYMC